VKQVRRVHCWGQSPGRRAARGIRAPKGLDGGVAFEGKSTPVGSAWRSTSFLKSELWQGPDGRSFSLQGEEMWEQRYLKYYPITHTHTHVLGIFAWWVELLGRHCSPPPFSLTPTHWLSPLTALRSLRRRDPRKHTHTHTHTHTYFRNHTFPLWPSAVLSAGLSNMAEWLPDI